MDRKAAINFARAGAQKLWAGTVTIRPDAKTGAHHHGHLESIIYVVKGKARMRWGEQLQFTAEAGPGDFIFVPPYVPHQEINASRDEVLECVLVRSDGQAVAINLDIEPVEKPETVLWIDPVHPRSGGGEVTKSFRDGPKAYRMWVVYRATRDSGFDAVASRRNGPSSKIIQAGCRTARLARPLVATRQRSPLMAKLIFVNLPVSDLARATAFYQAIGGEKNEQFCDETASCMVFSETIHAMLLTHDKFRQFTPKKIVDARTSSEVLICISADSRDAVDEMIGKAEAAGGGVDPRPKQDYGFMYGRSFEDPDGHIWEVMWMDVAAATAAQSAMADA